MTPGLRDLATYFAARVVPALATMCLTFLCIHTLSAEDYGRYSLTLLPASVAAGLVGGLSGQAMLRYAGELTPRAMRRGLYTWPLLASLCAVPIVLVYLAFTVGLSATAVLAAALVPLIALMDTRRSRFVAERRSSAVFAMDVLRALAALALTYALFRAGRASPAVPMSAQVLAVAGCLAVVRPGATAHDEARTRAVDRAYALYGIWFAGWIAVVAGFSLAERAIVESVSGLAASGRYAAQADIVNAVFAATAGALASSMMPSYLSMARAPDAPTLRRLRNLGLGGTALAAALCIGLGVVIATVADGRIVQTLAGDPATALVLVAAGALWTAGTFVQKPLELRGQTRWIFAAAALSMLLFFAVASWLGHAFGPIGIAAAKAAAGIAFTLIVWAMSRGAAPLR